MVVNKEVCIGCGSCVATCPVEAIELVEGVAKIDKEKCVGCGACKGACPVEAINED